MSKLSFKIVLEDIQPTLSDRVQTAVHITTSNLCGEQSTCDCSQLSSGIVSITKCQAMEEGKCLISNIEVRKVALKEMYNYHTKNHTQVISLIISNTELEDIVDFDKESLGSDWILMLVFENNPNLILGYPDPASRVVTHTLEFRRNGAKQFFGEMIVTSNLIFTNFSASLREIFDTNKSDEKPWNIFNAHGELTLQGCFSDFPDFLSFQIFNVTIRDVVSINETELVPNNFLTQVRLLRKLTIKNSEHVTIPKFYLENVYEPIETDPHKLILELELSNVQKNSLAGRNSSNLFQLNQVKLNQELRQLLSSRSNYSGCSSFCLSKNNSSAVQCSDLENDDKMACGICVKNIIGQKDLEEKLAKICAIKETMTTKTASNKSTSETKISETTQHLTYTDPTTTKG